MNSIVQFIFCDNVHLVLNFLFVWKVPLIWKIFAKYEKSKNYIYVNPHSRISIDRKFEVTHPVLLGRYRDFYALFISGVIKNENGYISRRKNEFNMRFFGQHDFYSS